MSLRCSVAGSTVAEVEGETDTNRVWYSGRGGDVQTPSLSTHQLHWERLRVLSRWTGLRFRVLHAELHRLRADEYARNTSEVAFLNFFELCMW